MGTLKDQRRVRVPEGRDTGDYEPCGCWNPNSHPLEEQQELLTTELSLHPQVNLSVILENLSFLTIVVNCQVMECKHL